MGTSDIVKNAVDFVVLDKLFEKQQGYYGNLTISPDAQSSRRTEKAEVRKETPKGVSITHKPFNVGYALSEIILGYVQERKTKIPENEPACRFFDGILSLIAERVPRDFSIPQVFFVPAGMDLRSKIRRGPDITTKDKTTRSNLYVPFSYVKSQECSRMPESVRKELTSIGADVLKNIDTASRFSVKSQNIFYGFFESYLSATYAISDEVRKTWRTEAKIPQVQPVYQAVVRSFPSLESLRDADEKLREAYIVSLKAGRMLAFTPTKDNPDEQKELLASVRKEVDEREKKRRNKAAPSSRS